MQFCEGVFGTQNEAVQLQIHLYLHLQLVIWQIHYQKWLTNEVQDQGKCKGVFPKEPQSPAWRAAKPHNFICNHKLQRLVRQPDGAK